MVEICKVFNLQKSKDRQLVTCGIANKGFSGLRSSSPASIFRLG